MAGRTRSLIRRLGLRVCVSGVEIDGMRVGPLEGCATSRTCRGSQSWESSPAGVGSGCDVDAALDALGAVCVAYERVLYVKATMSLAAKRDVARLQIPLRRRARMKRNAYHKGESAAYPAGRSHGRYCIGTAPSRQTCCLMWRHSVQVYKSESRCSTSGREGVRGRHEAQGPVGGGGAESTTRRVSRVRLGRPPRDREASSPPPGASSWRLEFSGSLRAPVTSLARS